MSIFIYHPDIKGKASDKHHKDWMEGDYISWGSQRQITSSTSTQGDRESSNTIISDLTLHRRMDKATAKLFLLACCGSEKEMKIHLTKTGAGDGSDIYMEYTLQNAIISHYEMATKASSRHRPIEEIKISFIGLQMKYITHDENNQPLAPIAVGFDTANNTKI